MTRTKENYQSESIKIKNIPIKREKGTQKKNNKKHANEKKNYD